MTRRPHRCTRTTWIAVLAVFLGACAHQTGTVVLLPEKDGRNAAVAVRQGDRELVLDKPYAAARQMSSSGPGAYTSNPQEVETLFGAALAAQPARPTSFTLYFVEGGDDFTPESRPNLDKMFSEIAQRPVPDIVVVGHTDTVGTDQANDALALRRAEAVRTRLIASGVSSDSIVAVGRGKRELRKQTPDNVAEPENRRVEIIVR